MSYRFLSPGFLAKSELRILKRSSHRIIEQYKGRPPGPRARSRERNPLGMRPSRARVKPLAHDATVLHDHAAHQGVGVRLPETSRGESQGARHPFLVVPSTHKTLTTKARDHKGARGILRGFRSSCPLCLCGEGFSQRGFRRRPPRRRARGLRPIRPRPHSGWAPPARAPPPPPPHPWRCRRAWSARGL